MARFTNQAQLRYGNSVANSNIAVGEILEVLSATKTAVGNSYKQDDSITYVVSIVNSGTTPITGLTLTDNLGAYAFGATTLLPLTYIEGTIVYYVNGVLQAVPTVTPGSPLTVTGISVPAGGNATIIYETRTNEFAPLAPGSEITNTATISGTGLTAVAVQETIAVESEPLLTIAKSVSPVPVTENSTLTYTFLIRNNGSAGADADTGIVITDTFNPILRNLTASYNGTTLTAGTDYTYDETTGEFATVAGKITVPAGTFTQDTTSGIWNVNPGTGTLVVTGTI